MSLFFLNFIILLFPIQYLASKNVKFNNLLMLEAVVYFKPGTITNLIKESRLLKTALLFSDTVYANN